MDKAKFTLEGFLNEKSYVREAKSYSLGNIAECKEMLLEGLRLTDRSILKVEWLPEYDDIVNWMADTKGKGLFLTGSLGRGKSAIVCGVIPLVFKAKLNKILTVTPARYIKESNPKKWAWVIDDLGQDVEINDYGTMRYPVQDIVCDCEDYLKLLIITTNLTSQQIADKYGDRVLNRIDRLCQVVRFKGDSLRK